MTRLEDIIEDFLQTKIAPNTKKTYKAVLTDFLKGCDLFRAKELKYHDM